MKDRQAGFSLIEAVIVVAAVGILAAAGWFVYQHNRPKATDAATNSSQTTNSQQTGTSNTTPTTTYLTLSEWGVRAPYSSTLKLTYAITTTPSGGGSAAFSSDQLTAADPKCVGRGGFIIRWASTDKVSEGTPDANTPTAQQAFAGKEPASVPYAHIGNYYYTFAHDQAACDDPSVTGPLQAQTNDAVKALVSKLQAISN